MADPIEIGGQTIGPGETKRLEIPVARLPSHTMLNLPVTVVNGNGQGPRLWLSAALHGDEINGMEIIRQVLKKINGSPLHGLVIAVPIVNVFGFNLQSRYLPDRRDLNRSFPGSKRGSLASRLANLFMTEIVARATHGIDLHTAAPPRINLPQVRCNLEDPETRRCAEAFGAPVMLHSSAPRGALRNAAARLGLPVLLYEAGEPFHFNHDAIAVGVEGVLRVMAELEMITLPTTVQRVKSAEPKNSTWIRAGQSGIFYLETELGRRVKRRERLGVISDPFGEARQTVKAPYNGMVIGHTTNPLVHQGDGILHLAELNPTQ
ncbi:MAG: succinylglutamate desuccinylase/aspartoacylase family protein [bacterium]|nr:succinylglutamate desuccinylase/aspartoacylase family protein [bacterium]